MLTGVYESALTTATVPEVLAAKQAGAVRCLHRVLGEAGRDVEEVVTVLRAGLERGAAARASRCSRGCSALDWPGDAWGRLWHAANLLREFRGDAHLAALLAHGIGALECQPAHRGLRRDPAARLHPHPVVVRAPTSPRPATTSSTGCSSPPTAALTERGAALRRDIEDATEAALDPVLEGMEHGARPSSSSGARPGRAPCATPGAFPDDDGKLRAG